MIGGASRKHDGTVLVITLWVLTILAILALTFAETMHVEARACGNQMQRTRALYAAKAGLQRAILAIESDSSGYAATSSEWAYLESEEDGFPFDDERYEVAVTDECGKIDLNSAEQELLERLPQLTEEMIDAVLDWRDDDDDARPNGAEQDYYGRLRPARACPNRPFLTLGELLLVRGVTREAFYGAAAGSPAAILAPDQAEADPEQAAPLTDVLTLYGGDNDLDAQGRERLNINLAGGDALAEMAGETLTEGDIQAILDYRRATGALDSIGELLRVEGITRDKMQQLADLVTTRSKPTETEPSEAAPDEEPGPAPEGPPQPVLPGGGGLGPMPPSGFEVGRQTIPQPGDPTFPPGFPPPVPGEPEEPPEAPQPTGSAGDIDTEQLPTADAYRPGIYNINTAPAEVLLAIDGMTEELAQAIIRDREEQPFTTRGELLRLSEVTDEVFVELIEQITVRSSTLRIVSVGSVEEERVRVRIVAIVDFKESEPVIVHLAEG
jgi:general secretion pathway protein K